VDLVGLPYRDRRDARISELETEVEQLRRQLPVVRLELSRPCDECKYHFRAAMEKDVTMGTYNWCKGPPHAAERPAWNGTLCEKLRTPHAACPSWRAKEDPDDAFVLRSGAAAPKKIKLYKVRFAASMFTALWVVMMMTSWRAYALAPLVPALVLLTWVARKLPN
jgi:hypothetical protein